MANNELTLEALPEMKKNDYKKLFKKIMTWKKAKAIILLEDYKLDGKKSSLAVPFKKPAEMQKEFKRIRLEKFHKPNKISAAMFQLVKGIDGNPLAKITLKKGSISPEKVMAKIAPAFEEIGVQVEVVGATTQEETSAEDSSLDTEDTPSVDKLDLLKSTTQAVNDFTNGLLPAYQAGDLEEEDLTLVLELEDLLTAFVEEYPNMDTATQQTGAKLLTASQQILPQLTKIKGAISGDDPTAALEMTFKQLKSKAQVVEKQTKKIKKTVLKNLKKGRVTDRDLEVVEQCLAQIEDFEDLYEDADDRLREKLEKRADRIQNKMKAQMQQLLEKVIAAAPTRQANREEDEAFQARMKEVLAQIEAIEKEVDDIEVELAEQESEPLPKGGKFLSFLEIE